MICSGEQRVLISRNFIATGAALVWISRKLVPLCVMEPLVADGHQKGRTILAPLLFLLLPRYPLPLHPLMHQFLEVMMLRVLQQQSPRSFWLLWGWCWYCRILMRNTDCMFQPPIQKEGVNNQYGNMLSKSERTKVWVAWETWNMLTVEVTCQSKQFLVHVAYLTL